jgi:pimeloyl-ACP methyl ester carboxylesterase
VVSKIIVASTMFNKSGAQPWFWEMMGHATFEQMPQPLKDAYSQINPDKDALYAMYKRDVARMQSFKDIKEDDIKAINASAFIIIGTEDVVLPEHAVEMYRLLPHGQLAILPGAHGEYIGEITTPQDINLITATISMIEKFLNGPVPKKN